MIVTVVLLAVGVVLLLGLVVNLLRATRRLQRERGMVTRRIAVRTADLRAAVNARRTDAPRRRG